MSQGQNHILKVGSSVISLIAPDAALWAQQAPPPGSKKFRAVAGLTAKFRRATPGLSELPIDPLYRLEDRLNEFLVGPAADTLSSIADRFDSGDPLRQAEFALTDIRNAFATGAAAHGAPDEIDQYLMMQRSAWDWPEQLNPVGDRVVRSYILDSFVIVSSLETCAKNGSALACTDVRGKLVLAARAFVAAHLAPIFPILGAAGKAEQLRLVLDSSKPNEIAYRVVDRDATEQLAS